MTKINKGRRIGAGVAATAMLATGWAGVAVGTAQADPLPQRPVTGRTLLQAKDVRSVFSSYTTIKAKSGTVAGKVHLSPCTGNDNLKDFMPITKTRFGSMHQAYEQEYAIRITQQAAFDGTADSSAFEALESITGALDKCAEHSSSEGLTYVVGTHVRGLGDFKRGIYYPQVNADGKTLAATIVVSNQDNVNVLEVSSYGELSNAQLTQLTRLAAKRAR